MGFLSGGKVIVGYDLGNRFSQISFSRSETGEAETLSQVAGQEQYNIPTALCKRSGTNQWLYGREALRCAGEEDGILVENLLELALDGEPVIIEGESYEPVALLALFFKRSLSLLYQAASAEKISALTITCEVLDRPMALMLGRMVTAAQLKTERIAFQSYGESYYSYMLRQPEELLVHRSVLLTGRAEGIRAYCMECNRRTTPKAVLIAERDFSFRYWERLWEEETPQELKEAADRELLGIVEEVCGGSPVESAFLIGEGFDRDWMKESLRSLCRNRRVFQGNNLFSKGACMGMQERISAGQAARETVFLGPDKLKANVGMNVLRQGEESYYALLDAGVSWYEAVCETEVYLKGDNELSLVITPLTGQNGKLAQISLEDFPGGVARLGLRLSMTAESALTVEIEDLGFGEIRAASGHIWKEKLELF
ncbi:MAG: DUF5716 family protein [Roseburia sp.]|nr:DUF5716 family protein [Roseburia sp.]MCM1097277.1 DUF5716 family protein [Ruminococcus flavefaciens]